MRLATKVLRVAALVLLVVVNAALLFLLLHLDGGLAARPAEQPPWPSTEEVASPSPSASRNSTSSPRATEPAAPERLLYALSSKTAWRATVGDCDTPGKIERSTDGGASWTRAVETGLAPIVRLGVETNGDLFAIGGTSQSCSARYVASASDGTVRSSRTRPVNVWFQNPDDRDKIHGPGETSSRPCKGHIVGLAPLDLSTALVVCDSGAAMSTRDSGRDWQQVARIPNALAVTSTNGQYWVAGTSADCDGIKLRPLDVNGSKSTVGVGKCAPVGEVDGGQLAVDVNREVIWVWAGSRVTVTRNAGRSWK
jgi:hypothetical protein